MNKNDLTEQRVKRVLSRVSRPKKLILYIRLRLHIALLGIIKFSAPRTRAHWLGAPRQRRYERLLIPAMYIGGILFFDGRDFATWSMYVGGVASIFVVLYSVYRLVPIKTAHWIGRKP
jgi:hypothetical protein